MSNTWKIVLILSLCLLLRTRLSTAEQRCKYMHFQHNIPGVIVKRDNSEDACRSISVCSKSFQIIRVEYPPYDDEDLITRILAECCGKCFNHSIISIPMENITPTVVSWAHFAYPFLGGIGANTLYGHKYIPVAPAPSLFYITPKDKAVMEQLMEEAITLYPMIIICLLLAIISGFIAWILETWFNEGEFPRPFLIGWFEGFWWSFISMTTVGYGDKTPKTIVARLFSVVWILMGVALFGIVSAEITKIIMQANNPANPTMFGARVGVLNYREYEASYVAMHGGLVVKPSNRGDFNREILMLVNKLRKGQLDGILLDKRTLAYAEEYFQNNTDNFPESVLDDVKFMLKKTIRTEKQYDGEKLAYGVLVRDDDDYTFFRDAFVDNRVSLATASELKWNEEQQKQHKDNEEVFSLFDPTSQLFLNTVYGMTAAIACIFVFGMFYEVRRRNLSSCCTRRGCVKLKEKEEHEGKQNQNGKTIDMDISNNNTLRNKHNNDAIV